MSDTPICDFVKNYAASGAVRAHMPGHKGCAFIGPEALDITEIAGADELYGTEGIIRESEDIASGLFGSARTLYSAEGSSLAIRAMLYLLLLNAKDEANGAGKRFTVLAARNAHRSFCSAAALLDMDVEWLYPAEGSLLSCPITPRALDDALAEAKEKPICVYLTSPDYLGNMAKLRELALVAHWHGVPLAVDNAHGAYLRFLEKSLHPLDLGADICCDSAHKTLPCLTGAAYLHISKFAPPLLTEHAERAMALFASTSPSYLILQSLDAANAYLNNGYRERLAEFSNKLLESKSRLREHGFELVGDEPLKISIAPKSFGYTGSEVSDLLRQRGIECELADRDNIVLMFTPETGEDLLCAENALEAIERREPVTELPPTVPRLHAQMSIREAVFSRQTAISTDFAAGRIAANDYCGCPPAVPIVMPGELIDENAVRLMKYCGKTRCVVCE